MDAASMLTTESSNQLSSQSKECTLLSNPWTLSSFLRMLTSGTGERDGATSFAAASAREGTRASNLERSMEDGHVLLNLNFQIISSGRTWVCLTFQELLDACLYGCWF